MRSDLYNWLKTGFCQSDKELSETFYFDKRDKEFFSILIADYFLFKDNLRLMRMRNRRILKLK
jgi:hypothetical protein